MRPLRQRPPISVTMMAKNAESTIVRAIDSVAQWAREFCLADTGSTDRTVTVAASACKRNGLRFNCVDYGPVAQPDAYRLDSPESFDMKFQNYSHVEFLCDWIGARQASLDLCREDYVLVLDDDETLLQAEMLPDVVEVFKRRKDVVVLNLPTRHNDDLVSFTARMGVRGRVHWGQSQAHQILYPITNEGQATNVRGACMIHDYKDRTDPSTRIPERALKVAYLDYCAGNRGDRILYYLGMEARFNYPDQAVGWFGDYFEAHDVADEQWASAQTALGELYERDKMYGMAREHYSAAADYVPTYPESQLCLARMELRDGKPWQALEHVHLAMETSQGTSNTAYSRNVREVAPYQILVACYAKMLSTKRTPPIGRVNYRRRAEAACRVGLQIDPNCPVLNQYAVELGLKSDASSTTPLKIQAPASPPPTPVKVPSPPDADRSDGPGVRAPDGAQTSQIGRET